jgi:hypothetical protein
MPKTHSFLRRALVHFTTRELSIRAFVFDKRLQAPAASHLPLPRFRRLKGASFIDIDAVHVCTAVLS